MDTPVTPRRSRKRTPRAIFLPSAPRYDAGAILPQGSPERNTKSLKRTVAAGSKNHDGQHRPSGGHDPRRDQDSQPDRRWYFHFEESL
jgi:hypothetical protein